LRGPTPFGNRPRPQHAPDEAPRIVPQPEDQIIRRPPFILALLFTPFSVLYKLFSTAFGLFSYIFPFLPRALGPSPAAGTARRPNTTGRKSLKPRDAAARLKREFEEEYGESSLQFFEGGYAQALDLAKKELKFLLVLLASPEHDDTGPFVRETLLSDEVQTFVNSPTNEIILWAGDVRDSEAYQVSTALRCNKFPFAALIAHTPEQSSTSMSVLARLTGPMPAGPYVAKLQAAITSHSAQLRTVREARNAQNFERTLRQEQDSAYERSLAQDRERARVRREAEAAAAEEARREQEQAEAATTLAAKKQQWRQWRAARIAPEPSPDAQGVVRIALKMPEAARITRRFPADAAIDELYAFVDCHGVAAEGAPASPPAAYEHEFDFRLVSTLPRVVYDPAAGGTIGERVGRNGNLIVEPVADGGDEE
jgi:FAS-associated factor 2